MSTYTRENMIKKLIDAALYCLNIENHQDLENIEKFLMDFFAIKGPDFFERFDTPEKIKEYSASLCDLWHNFQSTPSSDKPRIQFFENAFNREETFVSVIVKDYPFLVASTKIILKDLNLDYDLFMHPVITTVRDKTGFLRRVVKTKNAPHGTNCSVFEESVIHFRLNLCENDVRKLPLEVMIFNAFSDISMIEHDKSEMNCIMANVGEHYFSMPKDDKNPLHAQCKSVGGFLNWLTEGLFVTCGYRYFSNESPQNIAINEKKPSNLLGLFRDKSMNNSPFFALENTKSITNTSKQKILFTRKLGVRSRFNRGSFFDEVCVIDVEKDGSIKGVHQYLGLFTAKFFEYSPFNVPLLSGMLEKLFERFGFKRDWYNGRLLKMILESIPLDVIFSESLDSLVELCHDVLCQQNNITVFYKRPDQSHNILLLIYVPIEKYSFKLKELLKSSVEERMESHVRSEHIYLREGSFARIVFSLDLKTKDAKIPTSKKLAEHLTSIAKTWDEHLVKYVDGDVAKNITKLFPQKFKDEFSHESGIDIYNNYLSFINGDKDASFQVTNSNGTFCLSVLKKGEPLVLAHILSITEKFGLEISDQSIFQLHGNDTPLYVHMLPLNISDAKYFKSLKDRVIEGIHSVWYKHSENDILNTLIESAGLNIREIIMLRAYIKALMQMRIGYSFDYMAQTLVLHPKLACYFIDLFHARFDPKSHNEEKEKNLIQKAKKYIKPLDRLDDDRIFRRLLNIICATVRTNFYQTDANDAQKTYMAFKFNSHAIDDLPSPRPMFEIFVHSYTMEGIHLRGGKVARGGLRWSDRLEDYRSEVLALMKAQMIKNAVIVPLGSKGGFITKEYDALKQSGTSPQDLKNYVVKCYETFIQGLLDITDNQTQNGMISPENCVCHDEHDPYLVVAADKGTATFSDIANQISQTRGFWLGDAFASGGSQGYDHKKMGITAKGAWVSIRQHFKDMNHNIDKTPFTVVGVGDMSGDVFGNGILESPHARLIAAFNHEHIFIDPTPTAAAYKEYKRLFDLPGSKWTDYKENVLSNGGGIYSRKDKHIKLSNEAKSVLNIPSNTSMLPPNDIIKYILKANVDLLWFGGVGTYIKSKSESHDDVKDRPNNAIRVDGNDIRASVVGEGANLGMTQFGRIEYALNGGRLNTDAIDNSAGVDCSDHEVNLKILFQGLEQSKKIDRAQRDTLLETMTQDVSDLVLVDNQEQNFILSVLHQRKSRDLLSFNSLMNVLSKSNDLPLDRLVENLPDDEEIQRRKNLKIGLTRPELSVLLAYTKINLYAQIVSNVDDITFDTSRFLTQYFPNILHSQFQNAIDNHPLKSEIKATALVNYLINRLGILFFNEMRLCDNHELPRIISATLKVIDLFDLDVLWDHIPSSKSSPEENYTQWYNVINAMRQMVLVILRHNQKRDLSKIKSNIGKILGTYIKKSSATRAEDILNVVPHFSIILEYVYTNTKNISADTFHDTFEYVYKSLKLDIFDTLKKGIRPASDWERMVKNVLIDDYLKTTQKIICQIENKNENSNILNEHALNDYYEKMMPIQKMFISNEPLLLGHLTYSVKVLQQLVR